MPPVHPIDRLSVALARGTTRRTFVASVGAALGFAAASKANVQAGDEPVFCSSDAECTSLGLVCTSQGVCGYPECVDYGESCSGDGDCCGDFICPSGVCTVSPRCALETEGCSADGDCCPGMTCVSGACGIAPPAPPENTGGGNTGGGGGDTGGGGGAASGGGGTSGTTTSGVFVSGLPSTGVSGNSIRREKWGLAAAALAGAAGLLGLSRRSANPATDPNVEPQEQD